MIPTDVINTTAQGIIVVMLLLVDGYFVLKYTREDALLICDSKEAIFNNKKYSISQSILNRMANCERIKGALIKDETYEVHYDYRKDILLYNAHRYLERVCEEIKSLISDVTKIELEHISVSFIYKYPYETSAALDGWNWITGKEPTMSLHLDDLIKKPDSYYHYLISNDISISFENDKSKLISKKIIRWRNSAIQKNHRNRIGILVYAVQISGRTKSIEKYRTVLNSKPLNYKGESCMGKIVQFKKKKVHNKIVGALAVMASIVTIWGTPAKDWFKFALGDNAVTEEAEICVEKDWQEIAEKYNNEAFNLFEAGEFEQAIELYNKAIELETRGIEGIEVCYYNRGRAYFKLGDYQKAIGDYTRAIEIRPEGKYYSQRAVAYKEIGDTMNEALDNVRAIMLGIE